MASGESRTAVNADEKQRKLDHSSGDESILSDENVYEVEKIVGMSKVEDKVMYRVRWLGYSPQFDTWEPYENLLTCKDLVEEYVEREQKKKRKQVPEKPAKRKRQTTKDSQEEKTDELISTQLPVSDANKPAEQQQQQQQQVTTNPQLKDPFWKDLQEGRINVLAEEDMYSKVKGRSLSRHQKNSEDKHKKSKSSRKKAMRKSRNKSPNGDDGRGKKSSKPRRRVLPVGDSDEDAGDSQKQDDSGSTSSDTVHTLPSEDSNSNPSAADVQPMEVDTHPEQEHQQKLQTEEKPGRQTVQTQIIKRTATSVAPTTPPTQLLKPILTQPSSNKTGDIVNAKKVVEGKSKTEINTPVRRKQVPFDDATNNKNNNNNNNNNNSNNNNNNNNNNSSIANNNNNSAVLSVKNTGPSLESKEIQFEFSQYNPEEWIPKEAYNINQVVELTNVQFRNAVRIGDYEMLRRAMNSKTQFNLDHTDSSGTTLLMIAAMSGFDDIVELLIVRGANINACQRNGCTALMLAADMGHVCPVAVLLSLGAHMDVQQVSGETALMKACRKGHRQVVQLLLENGANFALMTKADSNAQEMAKMYNHSGIETLLLDHISRVTTAFEAQVFITLNNTARILHELFPIHCFSLNEGNVFKIHFNHQLQPPQSGVGMLLFIAHARIMPQDVKCRFYGPCAVVSTYLNSTKQLSLTEEANFVLSFSPLQNGENELVINTLPAIVSKTKLLVCAYKAQLNSKLS